MKANEFVTEGFFDTIKGALGRDKNAQAINVASELAVKAWKKQLAAYEATNDYNALEPGQYKKILRQWIDQSLFGKYSLDTAPQSVKSSVDAFIGKISSDPDNKAVLQQAFSAILNQTRKLALGGGKPAASKQVGGNTICNDPTKIVGQDIFVCGQKISPADPGYNELKAKISQQGT